MYSGQFFVPLPAIDDSVKECFQYPATLRGTAFDLALDGCRVRDTNGYFWGLLLKVCFCDSVQKTIVLKTYRKQFFDFRLDDRCPDVGRWTDVLWVELPGPGAVQLAVVMAIFLVGVAVQGRITYSAIKKPVKQILRRVLGSDGPLSRSLGVQNLLHRFKHFLAHQPLHRSEEHTSELQ